MIRRCPCPRPTPVSWLMPDGVTCSKCGRVVSLPRKAVLAYLILETLRAGLRVIALTPNRW